MIIHRRYFAPLLLSCCLLARTGIQAQKSVSELTLVYDYSVNPTGEGKQSGTENVYQRE